MPTNDQEPRYQLVSADGTDVIGSVYAEADGTLKLQEGSGSNNEASLAPDGTLSVPGVDTDSITTDDTHTKTIGSADYHYAGDYDGADADTRLDNAIAAANDENTIYLEQAEYGTNRTISKRLVLTGAHPESNGTEINAEWTFGSRVILSNCFITAGTSGSIVVNSVACVLKMLRGDAAQGITVSADDCRIIGIYFPDVTFETGTSGGIVDASTQTSVTDNGTNTVGDIA